MKDQPRRPQENILADYRVTASFRLRMVHDRSSFREPFLYNYSGPFAVVESNFFPETGMFRKCFHPGHQKNVKGEMYDERNGYK